MARTVLREDGLRHTQTVWLGGRMGRDTVPRPRDATALSRQESLTMNRYGAQAMEHWKENRPQAYQELEDQQEYFTQLGEEISQAVEARARELAGKEPEGEGYLQRLQRLNTARAEAEGAVLREVVLLEVEPDQE